MFKKVFVFYLALLGSISSIIAFPPINAPKMADIKNKASSLKDRIELGNYNTEELTLKINLSSLTVSLGYNLGFAGAGDIELPFPNVDATFKLGVVPIKIVDLINTFGGDNTPAGQTAKKFAHLEGKYLFFLKIATLLATIAKNKAQKKADFPQPSDMLVEINKLLIRELQTPGGENLSGLLEDLPAPIKDSLKNVEIPNTIDKGVVEGDQINLLTFLDRRFADVRNVIAKKFEFDQGYVADNSTTELTPYQTIQDLFAIFYRAQKDANKAIPSFITSLSDKTKNLGAEVEKTSGKDKRAEMGATIAAFLKAKDVLYGNASKKIAADKSPVNFKNYQAAKFKLLGFIILYFPYERVSGKTETIKDFIIREVRRIVPRSPGFHKIAPILDPILQPLGLSVDALVGKEQLPPEPPVPAGEDPLAEVSVDVDADNLDF